MKTKAILSFISLLILGSGCASLASVKTSRLDLIQSRNVLKCGVSGKIPGFSFLQSDGTYQGMDVDICKAMAAAFLGDANKVVYRPLTAPERFTALNTGEIDLLSRNTTFNLSRDSNGGNNVAFAPVIFYDGQSFMVKRDSGIRRIEELASANICVGSGTTTEQNLYDTFSERNIEYTPVKFQDINQVIEAYQKGRCIAMTSDRSQLFAAKSSFKESDDHIILDEIISKEPLAPASIGTDQKLSDAMRWTIYALFQAEEMGISSENIDLKVLEAYNNENLTTLRRFFGIEGSLGDKLGLPNDFVVKIIQSTGNYSEIYDRNLGPENELYIPRGLNSSYIDGGLLFSPPFK